MSYLYGRPMPVHPLGQKHGHPHTDNNYGFLRSLTGRRCADVDVRVAWNNPKRRTKAAGCRLYGLHGDTPASNGYHNIMDGNRCRPMTHSELHRGITAWPAARVQDWRRGESARSARPRLLGELYNYVKVHGGTIVAELKSRIFATHQWVVDQLVATARRHNHAAWFKALANMWGVAAKAAKVAAALGWFALIFGVHIKGRAHRLAAGRPIVAGWPPAVRARTRIW